MSDVAVQAPEVPERVNSFARIFGVLFSPKATFESIVRQPTWFAPILVLTILSLVVIGLFSHRVGWRSFFEKQLESNSRVQEMPADQREQVLQSVARFYPPVIYVIGAVSPIVAALIVSAVLLGIFNGLAGAGLKFKTSFAIAAYASSPSIIRGLLGILVVLLKDPATIDLQNLVASNGAIFLSNDAAKWLVALMRSIDVFTIWPLVLMAIGYHCAAPKKLSTGGAFAWIFALYAVIVLAVVGLTAAFT